MGSHSHQIVGRYGIYGKIGSGGMATVHFGRLLGAVGFSRTVAVKRLHPHLTEEPEFRSTMIDEARMAARIDHPNVVSTLDVVEAGGELLVVMDYVRGESLARLLRAQSNRGGRVPLPIASAIVIGALQGLHAAHEATTDAGLPLGIVHRDVSPQNILVGVDGLARVIDFGVAKASGRLQTTRDGMLKGKVSYMAPEQLSRGEATRAVDVYGMGIVLWEMLVGMRLFHGDSDGALLSKVMAGAKERPSRFVQDLPAALDAFVMKALATEPAERFATAKEMAETLLRVVPPSFPTDVGAWVEDMAGEALAQRKAMLAEIESSSGTSSRPFDARPPEEGATKDDGATVVSQPSSLAVETPRSTPLGLKRSVWVAAGVAAAIAVACVAAALVLRARRVPVDARPSASAEATTSEPTAFGSAQEPPTDVPTIEFSALPSASDETPPRTAPRTPAAPVRPTKPRPACDPPYYFDAKGIKHYKRECD